MVSFPPCKINLGLQILNKREDGYHNLSTGFYPVPWTDILEIIPAEEMGFTCTGLAIPGKENMCLKAYQLVKKDFDLPPVKIHLHKIIPIGAGLGGGSSDAAHTLRVINSIFELKLTREILHNYASQLGSDCAFFVQDKAMLGSGRGEVLSEVSVNLNGKFLVIIKPELHISTAEAYADITPQGQEQTLLKILENPISGWRTTLQNDFEKSIFKKYPSLKDIKETLYLLGATYASMSGSGSAVFGIFERELDVRKSFAGMQKWCGLL